MNLEGSDAMQRVWKIWLTYVGSFVAVLFIHEYIHALTSMTFGYPSWVVFNWPEWVARYTWGSNSGTIAPALWVRLVIRYSPELVFLSAAYILTWKYRNDFAMILTVPFLLISILGFLGHAGYIEYTP